jgi:hypothetical protein
VTRGSSVRNGGKPVPARLDIDAARPRAKYQVQGEAAMPVMEPPRRLPTLRAASESRAPGGRPDLLPPRRRASQEQAVEEYPEDVYDMCRTSRGPRGQFDRRRMNQPGFIQEEEEYASDYDDGAFDENEFEMVPSRGPRARAPSQRGASRRPDIRKVRVKVHAAEDTRYIMIGTAIEFPDLQDKIKEKFGLRKRFKIKVRDDDVPDGDMITMGDQDDLEMAMMSVKSAARNQRLEMGKMEASLCACIRFARC